MSLLQLSLQEDEADASELFFGSVAGPLESSNSPEAVAWRQKCNNTIQQLAPLQRSQVSWSTRCADWHCMCTVQGLVQQQYRAWHLNSRTDPGGSARDLGSLSI
jgi:hypothetical protein